MPHSTARRARPLLLPVAVIITVGIAAAPTSRAAPKPLPDLSPEEIQLRSMVEPLRDGVTEGPELDPLFAWLDARETAGKGRDAERELRRVLKRITDDHHKDLLRAAEWVRVLQIQRSKLYQELAEDSLSVRRAVEESEKFPPVPLEAELLPGRAELSDGFIAGDVTTPHRAHADTPEGTDDIASETEDADTHDIDGPALLNRLTLDLTALGHLLHECDNDYEREKERHRTALNALTQIMQARRAASAAAAKRGG
jgi:hypothetical protein